MLAVYRLTYVAYFMGSHLFIPNLIMSIADSSQIATGCVTFYARNNWNHCDDMLLGFAAMITVCQQRFFPKNDD